MNTNKKSGWHYFKRSLPLTIMALPALALMILFKYLPLAGIVLAFKKYNIRDGIFGSAWNGLKNFEYLFKTKDAWIITRNTLGYNIVFIVLDLVLAVTMAVVLNELHQKRTAKVFQTIFMAPYFLSWVVVSFIAYSFLSVDNGFINRTFGMEVTWYSQKTAWPFILVIFQIWKTIGYSTVMYLGSIVGISNDYYEAALMDGVNLWQLMTKILVPIAKPVLATVIVFNLLYIWNEYPFASIMIENPAYYTISRGIAAFQGQYNIDYGGLAAYSVMVLLPELVFYGIFQRHVVDGMTVGAVKG